MVDRLGAGGGFGKAGLEAMLKFKADSLQKMRAQASGLQASPDQASSESKFKDSLSLADAVKGVDDEVRQAEELTSRLLTGEVTDLHEVATQIKQSDLSFKFALAVRNKLIDAYREVMRMGV